MPADEAGGVLASVDAHVVIAAEGVSHSAAGFGGCHSCGRCDWHGAGDLATECTAHTPACCTSQEMSLSPRSVSRLRTCPQGLLLDLTHSKHHACRLSAASGV